MELKLRRCPVCGSFPSATLHENRDQASYSLGVISCDCGHRIEKRVAMYSNDRHLEDIEELTEKWECRESDSTLALLKEYAKTLSDDVLPYENDSFASLKEQIVDRIGYMTDTITVELKGSIDVK